MTNQTNQGTQQHSYTSGSCGTVFPFDQINEPGTYICQWSGHLLRVPEDGLSLAAHR